MGCGVWPSGPTDQGLASGHWNYRVRLWRLSDGAPLATLEGHKGRVECLAISPDGHMLASGSLDKTVRLWKLPEGTPLAILGDQTNGVESLMISPGRQVLVSVSSNGTVRLWILELLRLSHLPVIEMTLADLAWVEKRLQDRGRPVTERSWLQFIGALVRWWRRFDIGVEDAPRQIEMGKFDITL